MDFLDGGGVSRKAAAGVGWRGGGVGWGGGEVGGGGWEGAGEGGGGEVGCSSKVLGSLHGFFHPWRQEPF